MDYTEIEAKVESDMVRTELEPVPEGFWLKILLDIFCPLRISVA